MNLVYNAVGVPHALMFAASNEQDLLCRVFGHCLVGLPIDSEVGDLRDQQSLGASKLFTYMRFNADLTETGLRILGLPHIKTEDVSSLDSIEHIDELRQIGQAVAATQVRTEYFADFR